MQRGATRGAIVLIISGFICKFFGALFRLPLTNIVGMEGIGAFQMIMSLYSLTLVLVTGGVTTSLARLVSSARARGEFGKVTGYLRVALTFSLGLSILLGAFFLFFAGGIASAQGINGESYRLLLLLLPLGALIGVFRGIIQGYENMTPTALSQIIEQVIKFAFGLLFAYLFTRSGRGVFGAFLGITLSELVAAFYLALFLIFKIKFVKHSETQVKREFFSAVIPLSLGGAVIPLTHAFDSLVIVSRLALAGIDATSAKALFGLQTGVVGAILNFPLIISMSVAMAVLPKLTFLVSKGDITAQKSVISKAFAAMWLCLLPLVFGIMSLSQVLYPIIYPSAIKGYLNVATSLTLLGGVAIILTAIMQFLITILQSKGEYNFVFIISLIGGIVKVLLVVLLAPIKDINIYALPLSNFALAFIVILGALIKLKGLVKIDYADFFIPLLAAIVMFILVKIFVRVMTLNPIWLILLSATLGGVAYLALVYPTIKGLVRSFLGKNKKRRKKHE